MLLALTFKFLKLGVELVAFAPGGFQVEHQVFHVEPQLAQRILHERQDAPAPLWCFRSRAPGAGITSRGNVVGQMLESLRQVAGCRLAILRSERRKLGACGPSVLLQVVDASPEMHTPRQHRPAAERLHLT